MRFEHLCTPARVATWVADRVTERVEQGARVLGVATGTSPLPVYEVLIERHQAGEASLSNCDLVLLDEYVGVPRDDPRSFHNTIMRVLAEPIGIPPERVLAPDGCAVDLGAACRDFCAAIESTGGVDVQLLGIGRNGHIAFNEPGSSLSSRTRLKTLAKQTIDDNARFFEHRDDVPIYAITMGVGTILEAREILLLANGANKADAIAAAVEGPVTSMITASALQMHPSTRVYVDEPAASKLKMREYYDWIKEKKPGAPRA